MHTNTAEEMFKQTGSICKTIDLVLFYCKIPNEDAKDIKQEVLFEIFVEVKNRVNYFNNRPKIVNQLVKSICKQEIINYLKTRQLCGKNIF